MELLEGGSIRDFVRVHLTDDRTSICECAPFGFPFSSDEHQFVDGVTLDIGDEVAPCPLLHTHTLAPQLLLEGGFLRCF